MPFKCRQEGCLLLMLYLFAFVLLYFIEDAVDKYKWNRYQEQKKKYPNEIHMWYK